MLQFFLIPAIFVRDSNGFFDNKRRLSENTGGILSTTTTALANGRPLIGGLHGVTGPIVLCQMLS